MDTWTRPGHRRCLGRVPLVLFGAEIGLRLRFAVAVKKVVVQARDTCARVHIRGGVCTGESRVIRVTRAGKRSISLHQKRSPMNHPPPRCLLSHEVSAALNKRSLRTDTLGELIHY